MARAYIRAEWSARAETLTSACILMESFLVLLASQHPLLSNWYALGKSKAQSLGTLLPTTSAQLAPIVIAGSKMKGADAAIPDIGLSLSGWNGKDNDQSASFSVQIGSTSKWIKNTALVELPKLNDKESQILLENLNVALRNWGRPDRIVVNGQVKWPASDGTGL